MYYEYYKYRYCYLYNDKLSIPDSAVVVGATVVVPSVTKKYISVRFIDAYKC